MSILEIIEQQQQSESTILGIVTAKITKNNDPEGLGRVKVRYGWRYADEESDWIRILTPMAGKQMGVFYLPEIDDEVIVAFQNGDINSPIVLGMVWSRNIPPPSTNDNGKNDIRMIKSRSGHKIILDDKDGNEKISIIDKSGNNSLVFETAHKSITITSEQDISLLAENGKIVLNAKKLEFTSTEKTSVTAGTDFTVDASSGKTEIDASQLDFKGSAQGSLDGGASLTVKASGNLTIQGAIVNIN